MSEAKEEYRPPGTVKSLTVLPHSGKVEQLKRELSQPDPAAPAAAPSPVPQDASQPGDTPAANAPPMQKLIEGKVIAALRTVYDPEIPINLYDLGLIYEINVDEEANVMIKMTLTAPACPVAGSLPGEVARRIEAIPEVKSADVMLVWDPPWSKDRMSEEALMQLGMM
jgi:FeS assembly SUF system protein